MAGLGPARAALVGACLCCANAASFARDALPLWELENTSNRVLIMGSVHFLREADYPIPDGLLAAYAEADRLVMEIDMDDLDPLEAQAVMTNLGISAAGRGLEDVLGAENYALVAARARSLGLPIELFRMAEPWFAALTISQMQMLALGFDPAWGIETQLVQRAGQDGKEILGLETIGEQLGFLDRLDEKTQVAFLMQSLEEVDRIREELDSMVAAWRTGDTPEMAKLFLADMARETPALYDALLVQRNRSWIDALEALADRDEDYLVVVGTLHLVGDDSVLEMLEAVGYPARQLSPADLK